MDEEKRFRVVYRTEVPRGEFAYDNAVNKIIELNEIFDPNFIYVDAGSGEQTYFQSI
jgi:replicative DNA helicase